MLAQYCSETLRAVTDIDSRMVTNAVLTIKQGNTTLNIRDFDADGGVFTARISGDAMAMFKPGNAMVQLRGFIGGEEFKSCIATVRINPVLLQEVLSNDRIDAASREA